MSGFDTGGINWNINVQDNFTQSLRQFTQLVDQANASMQQAQATRGGGPGGGFRAAGRAAAGAGPQVQGLTNQFRSFQAALNSGTAAGNRLVFTLRNIIGVGAGLAAIQQVQGAFRGLVEAGIDFNRQVEDSVVGIAGLLSAVGKVHDAQGNLVKGAEAFNFTQEIAIDQVQKLRQATLRTTASFQELADTFQVAVAPGLRAGLDVDQIRELAISVSQAAGALSVPTNQLSEEIRALLTGTIQARTTRIATALGIKPDDIRKAKNEVGGLAKFLDDKFKAFEIAAERVAGTFSGTFRRAQTAISLAAGSAAEPLFEEIRKSFLSVFDVFTERDVFGSLIPDERAVQVLGAVFDGIADAVESIREGVQGISFERLLQAAKGLGSFFATLGQVVTGFVSGAVSVVGQLSNVLRGVFQGTDVVEWSKALGKIITSVALIGSTFGLIHIAISTIILPLRTINTMVDTLVATSRLLLNPWTLILVAALAIAAATEAAVAQQEKLRNEPTVTSKKGVEEGLQDSVAQAQREFNEAQAKLASFPERGVDKATSFFVGLRKEVRDTEARLQGLKKQLEDVVALKKLSDQELKALGISNSDIAELRRTTPRAPIVAPVETTLSRVQGFVTDLLGKIQGELDKKPVEVKVTVTVPPKLQALSDRLKEKHDIDVAPGDLPFSETGGGRVEGTAEITDKFHLALIKMQDLTEQSVALMTQTIQAFGSLVADVIIDAFDPSNDVSFKERFARFLQGIAKQIITMLTQIAVAKLLLEIGFSGATASTGGLVASRGGMVQAFADGGPVHVSRPAGIPASDTVPAWLTPGEFVQKASAVARYGADAMSALNAGLLDPEAFRNLAGLGKGRSSNNITRARRIAFADGGVVGQAAAVSQVAGGGPTPAFIVGNDAAVDRFLRGGKSGFLDFVRENSGAMKAILGQ